MNRALLLKTLAIGMLVLLLLVPLALIEGVIEDRAAWRMQAQEEIAATHAGAQVVAGPVLVLPYVETTTTVPAPGSRDAAPASHSEQRTLLVFPDGLAIDGDVEVELRRRGLHAAPVWRARALVLEGSFEPARLPAGGSPRPGTTVTIVPGEPYVAFSVSDLRGFVATPAIEVGGRRIAFAPGSAAPFEGPSVRAPVEAALLDAGAAIPFRLQLDLAGTRELSFVPLGDETRATLRSNWPHPSFGGRFLPLERTIGGEGFDARWSVPAIATQARAALPSGRREAGPGPGRATSPAPMDAFGVRLVEPVDLYQQATRATKYGVLFVVLTFGAFWLFEALRGVPIHPVQYGFVGAALAIFFLLLLALSEHLPFGTAYAIAAAACITLVAVYLAAVLGGVRVAAGFAAGLSLLHGALYAVLRLEDTALLVGSLLLFSALAAAMLASRRVDWTRFGLPPAQPRG